MASVGWLLASLCAGAVLWPSMMDGRYFSILHPFDPLHEDEVFGERAVAVVIALIGTLVAAGHGYAAIRATRSILFSLGACYCLAAIALLGMSNRQGPLDAFPVYAALAVMLGATLLIGARKPVD